MRLYSLIQPAQLWEFLLCSLVAIVFYAVALLAFALAVVLHPLTAAQTLWQLLLALAWVAQGRPRGEFATQPTKKWRYWPFMR